MFYDFWFLDAWTRERKTEKSSTINNQSIKCSDKLACLQQKLKKLRIKRNFRWKKQKHKKAPCRLSVSVSSFHPRGLTDVKWFNPAECREEKEAKKKKRKKILIKKTRSEARKRRRREDKKEGKKTLIFDGGFKGHYWRLWKVTKGWKLWGVESRGWGGVRPPSASSPLFFRFYLFYRCFLTPSPPPPPSPFLLFLPPPPSPNPPPAPFLPPSPYSSPSSISSSSDGILSKQDQGRDGEESLRPWPPSGRNA